jgi:glyoxylase-like metal-dependent hydrolase (beta-lactamase superfamily II)
MSAPHPTVLDHPLATPPAPGTVIEVAPGILWLRMPLPFALDHINLWLLAEDDGWTAVDCGYGDAATRSLWETHFAHTLQGRPITRIIATHFHPDHLGNAQWLSARFACPVAMTLPEFLTAHAVAAEVGTQTARDTCAFFRQHGMATVDVNALAARGNTYRRGVPDLPATLNRLLPDDDIRAGGVTWRIIPGYGHSPEHASLYAADVGVLIAGDMLLPRISTNVSVGPSDPDADSLGRFLTSLLRFEDIAPDALVLPSHGLPFRGIPLRIGQLQVHHDARLAELEQAIKEAPAPVTAAAMVPVLFRRELDLQQCFFAMGETIAHLNHLWRRERIRRARTADGHYRFSA